MIVTFILPAIGKKHGQKYIGTWKMEPLTIAVLKSLTPKSIETKFFDDRIELIDYNVKTDLVAITVETYTAKRSYFIAKEFKKRGVKVVLGGYHVTLLEEEALNYADSAIVGNAESVWEEVLEDFKNGKLKTIYRGTTIYKNNFPDKSIFKDKKYLKVSLVETGRGCNHKCEFCAISSYYNCRYYPRNLENIIENIKRENNKYFFLVDDNLVANREHAISLFKAMESLKIKWAGQGTINMAKDKELLCAMKKSGCELMLIGFESLNEDNLMQMGKKVNLVLSKRDELVNIIHNEGIGIYATFVFGYDFDDERTINDALEFAKKHKFYTAAFNHLLPFPGTKLYERLLKEKRLLYDKWWLEEGYNYGELSFLPKSMSPEKMSNLCRMARKEFSSIPVVLKRGISSMKRSSPLMWSLFWAMNLRIGEEVDLKMNVPIGENLDELPK